MRRSTSLYAGSQRKFCLAQTSHRQECLCHKGRKRRRGRLRSIHLSTGKSACATKALVCERLPGPTLYEKTHRRERRFTPARENHTSTQQAKDTRVETRACRGRCATRARRKSCGTCPSSRRFSPSLIIGA